MGKKRNNKRKEAADRGAAAQDSFKKLVAEAAKNAVKPYLDKQIQALGFQLQQQQQESLRALYTRLVTVEGILMEKFDIDEAGLANLVADTEDKAAGLRSVDVIEEGDLVRLEVATKAADQEEFQGNSRLVVEAVGLAPLTLGPEIEPQLVGLKVGEVKEVAFGADNSMVAKLTINRVSRKLLIKEGADNVSENAGE